MKQISNWVFGSFFRTIGRLLVFVLLGFIIAHFIDFGSLKDSFSITDLFFDKLDALSITSEQGPATKFFNSTITFKKTVVSDCPSGQIQCIATQHLNFYQTLNLNKNYKYLVIPFTFSGYNANVYYSSGYNAQYFIDNIGSVVNVVGLKIHGGGVRYCELQNSAIVCPLYNEQYDGLYFVINLSGNEDASYNFWVNDWGYLANTLQDKTTDAINNNTNAITNQTQQQEQQHQEVMDSNTTQAENEASEFFEDFEQEDFGGLSAIITAPLNTIRSLLNSSCTNLVLPLPYVNENLTLPCMTSIYTTHFGAFFTIYQTIILAIIAYRCIRSIYYDIHGFTNPNDDRIEVMDL